MKEKNTLARFGLLARSTRIPVKEGQLLSADIELLFF
jgi:hypothetical protein